MREKEEAPWIFVKAPLQTEETNQTTNIIILDQTKIKHLYIKQMYNV
jgi:hypothetical protein